MKKKQFLVASLLALGVLIGATACKGGENSLPEPQVAEVTLSKENVTLEINGEYQLAVDYEGDETLVWSVSDSTIVSVENGKIIGLKSGTATVTVTAGDCTDSCTVTVSGYDESRLSLKLANANLTLYKDDEKQIEATVTYNGETITPTVEKSYMSTDAEIVSVDENGLLTAKALGNATISVVYKLGETELSSSVNVTVVSTGKLIIDQEYVELDVSEANKRATLTAKAYEKDVQNANAEIIWSAIEGQDVVSIDGATIIAVNAGETTITATYVDKSGIVQTDAITVTVDSITIDSEKSLSLMKDDYLEGYAPNTQELFGNADAIIGGYVLSEDGWKTPLPYANGKYDISTLAVGTMDFYVQTRNVVYKVSLELSEKIHLNNQNFKSKLRSTTGDEALTGYYVLDEDIMTADAAYGAWWRNGETEFSGTLDGNGHKIYDSKFTYGLFNKLSNATIKNLAMENIMLPTAKCGVFASINEGTTTFENVYVSMYQDSSDRFGTNAGFVYDNTTAGAKLILKDCVVYAPAGVASDDEDFGFVSANAADNSIDISNCTFINGNGKIATRLTFDEAGAVSSVENATVNNTKSAVVTLTDTDALAKCGAYVKFTKENFATDLPTTLMNSVVVLTDDVDLNGTYLGEENQFGGVFIGQGHTVSGIKVTGDQTGGLFKTFNGSLVNVAIKGEQQNNSGLITYQIGEPAYLENVYVETTISGNATSAAPIAGFISKTRTHTMKNVVLYSKMDNAQNGAVFGIIKAAATPTFEFENCYYITSEGTETVASASTKKIDANVEGLTGYTDYNTFYDAAYDSLNTTMQSFLPEKTA